MYSFFQFLSNMKWHWWCTFCSGIFTVAIWKLQIVTIIGRISILLIRFHLTASNFKLPNWTFFKVQWTNFDCWYYLKVSCITKSSFLLILMLPGYSTASAVFFFGLGWLTAILSVSVITHSTAYWAFVLCQQPNCVAIIAGISNTNNCFVGWNPINYRGFSY